MNVEKRGIFTIRKTMATKRTYVFLKDFSEVSTAREDRGMMGNHWTFFTSKTQTSSHRTITELMGQFSSLTQTHFNISVKTSAQHSYINYVKY